MYARLFMDAQFSAESPDMQPIKSKLLFSCPVRNQNLDIYLISISIGRTFVAGVWKDRDGEQHPARSVCVRACADRDPEGFAGMVVAEDERGTGTEILAIAGRIDTGVVAPIL